MRFTPLNCSLWNARSPPDQVAGWDEHQRYPYGSCARRAEPFGNFSIETPEFQAEFNSKNIRDAFKVGADIDAIARASISVGSSARAIRNSARRVARALLTPPGESR